MSRHAQVSDALRVPHYSNLHFNNPEASRITNTGVLPERSIGTKKRSFKSINLLLKPESSFDNNLQKNKVLMQVDSANKLAMERKLKRKSFFEHVCGGKSAKSGSDVPKQKMDQSSDRIRNDITLLTKAAQPKAESSKRNITNAYAPDGVYGSTSTVDSSDLSIDRMMNQKLTTKQIFFVDLKIKKAKLTKTTHNKFEFVCLTDHIKNQANHTVANNFTEKRFPNNYFGNEIFGIEDDLLEWDGKCVELDEKTFMEVFSKSKH